ncbi:MAG TPA: hypothetical protein VK578_10295 [Edaphobacter sp.]|nr:hypothetical protein [Edaphobacter sp.]
MDFCKSLWPLAKTFDEHSQRTLDHELEISFFHIALKIFCEKNKLKLYWQKSDLKCTVSPDAMFGITDPAKPDGKNTLYYFLEMERAKIGHYRDGEPSIMRKLGKYYAYYGTAIQENWNEEQVQATHITSLPRYQFYCRTFADDLPQARRIIGWPTVQKRGDEANPTKLIKASLMRYGSKRKDVIEKINRFLAA